MLRNTWVRINGLRSFEAAQIESVRHRYSEIQAETERSDWSDKAHATYTDSL